MKRLTSNMHHLLDMLLTDLRKSSILPTLIKMEETPERVVYTIGVSKDELENATFAGSPFNNELIGLIRAGNKIEAIKRYRAATNMGLKESKEYVDKLAMTLGE